MKREHIVNLSGKYTNNSAILINNDDFLTVELFADKTGFYEVQFEYNHTDWDQWVAVEILHSDGTSTDYMPTLPPKRNKVTVTMYLKSGKNAVTVRHGFGHNLTIKNIKTLKFVPKIKPQITPSCDVYCSLQPKDIKIELVHYGNEPVGVYENGCEIPFTITPCEFKGGDAYYSGYKFIRSYVVIKNETLAALDSGVHKFVIALLNGDELEFTLNVQETMPEYPLNIISFDVNHANASLIKLPNGKNLLVDSGGCSYVYRYLKNNDIKIDYYLLTHYHCDHFAYRDEILRLFNINIPSSEIALTNIKKPFTKRAQYLSGFGYLDSSMLCRYDELHEIWDLGGVKITALNSRYNQDGSNNFACNDPQIEFNEYNYENATSVSFLLNYNGFGYYHGADNYSYTQKLNLEHYIKQGKADQLKCEYFYANHHFHCDLCLDFIKHINPVAVYIPANQAVYSRSTYNQDYLKGFSEVDFDGKRLRDTFISHANGSVKVNVKNKDDWYYETIKENYYE